MERNLRDSPRSSLTKIYKFPGALGVIPVGVGTLPLVAAGEKKSGEIVVNGREMNNKHLFPRLRRGPHLALSRLTTVVPRPTESSPLGVLSLFAVFAATITTILETDRRVCAPTITQIGSPQ